MVAPSPRHDAAANRVESIPTFAMVAERADTSDRIRLLHDSQAAVTVAIRPYALRYAAVSTWLNAGVPASQVAKWAGHPVEVLLTVYAKCPDRQDRVIRERLRDAPR